MTKGGTDIASCAVRLEELVAKCATFFQAQFRRLEDACAELQELENSSGSTPQEDLTEQQAQWERKRAEEADRISEQLDYLTQAWSLLEEEQRRQLTQGRTPSSPTVMEQEQAGAGHSANSAVSSPTAPLDLIDAPGDRSSTSAAIQFQKLKREIRQHARRNR